jgi:hypothetical protein
MAMISECAAWAGEQGTRIRTSLWSDFNSPASTGSVPVRWLDRGLTYW